MTLTQVDPDIAFKTTHYPSFPSTFLHCEEGNPGASLLNTNFQSGVTRKISQYITRLTILPLKSTRVFTWMMQFMVFCQHMCSQAVRQKLTVLTFKKICAKFGEKQKSYSFTLPCSQKSSYIQTDYIWKLYSINHPNLHTIGSTVLVEKAW